MNAPRWATARLVTVEARDATGALRFDGEQPPSEFLRVKPDAVLDYYFRKVGSDGPNDWESISAFFRSRGWSIREVTW